MWGIMSDMTEVLAYAREKAPQDVLATLDWLTEQGFVPVSERGGRDESFGNLLLGFEQPPLRLRVTRDRGQWSLEIATARTDFVPLNVLLTAMSGDAPDPGRYDLLDQLPEVLPGGAEWREFLPPLVIWLGSSDRSAEITEAGTAWKAAMKRWWASRQTRAT
jgi:hypothetical protein